MTKQLRELYLRQQQCNATPVDANGERPFDVNGTSQPCNAAHHLVDEVEAMLHRQSGVQHSTPRHKLSIDNAKELPASLVRRICRLYLVDYCCLSFELPAACRGDDDLHLRCESPMQALGLGFTRRPLLSAHPPGMGIVHETCGSNKACLELRAALERRLHR